MAKLVPITHNALHQIAEEVPVDDISGAKIQKVIKDMREALYTYDVDGYVGVAIAAPQIGIPLRIFLVHDTAKERHQTEERIPDLVAINPTIIKTSKDTELLDEGCLSVPNQYGHVVRAKKATIKAYNEKGELYEYGGSGLLAQIFQHEVDHLDGTLFVDRAEQLFEVEQKPREETS